MILEQEDITLEEYPLIYTVSADTESYQPELTISITDAYMETHVSLRCEDWEKLLPIIHKYVNKYKDWKPDDKQTS